MPKKEDKSKKSEQKKKASQIEDKTFGLKNKNKSTKVMKFVESTTKSIQSSGDPKERAKAEAMKRERVSAKGQEGQAPAPA